MTDFMLSSFRIVSPTSFVYGESVDASNFIQLDDQECHFQPVNITLQVPAWGVTQGVAGMRGPTFIFVFRGNCSGLFFWYGGVGGARDIEEVLTTRLETSVFFRI